MWVNNDVGAFWFFTSLFITEIIFRLLVIILRNKQLIFLFCIILFVLGTSVLFRYSYVWPWATISSFSAIMFYWTGWFTHRKMSKYLSDITNRLRVAVVCSACFVIIAFSIMLSPDINMRTSEYENPVSFYLNATAMTLAILGFFCSIEQSICNLSILKNIGRYSVVYLCLNQFVIRMVRSLCSQFITINIGIKLFIMLIVVTLLYIISYYTSKSKVLKHLFGIKISTGN